MKARILLDTLGVAERLKDTTRHCYTKCGRPESVAEHSWMMALMAFFMKDEFPEVNMNKVIMMCIIHDLGDKYLQIILVSSVCVSRIASQIFSTVSKGTSSSTAMADVSFPF